MGISPYVSLFTYGVFTGHTEHFATNLGGKIYPVVFKGVGFSCFPYVSFCTYGKTPHTQKPSDINKI